MKKHRGALLALEPELQQAIAREQAHNRTTGPELAALDQQKQADNLKTQKVLAQLKEVESNINKDLAAGLITKGDAATQLCRAEPGAGRLHGQQNCRGPADRQRSGQDHDWHQLAGCAGKASRVAV